MRTRVGCTCAVVKRGQKGSNVVKIGQKRPKKRAERRSLRAGWGRAARRGQTRSLCDRGPEGSKAAPAERPKRAKEQPEGDGKGGRRAADGGSSAPVSGQKWSNSGQIGLAGTREGSNVGQMGQMGQRAVKYGSQAPVSGQTLVKKRSNNGRIGPPSTPCGQTGQTAGGRDQCLTSKRPSDSRQNEVLTGSNRESTAPQKHR